jgi:hypothetical protein
VWCVPLAARPKEKTMPRKKTETPAIEVKAVPRVETLTVKVDASEALKQLQAAHAHAMQEPLMLIPDDSKRVQVGDILLCRPFPHESHVIAPAIVSSATHKLTGDSYSHEVTATAFVSTRGPVTLARPIPVYFGDPGAAYAPCAWTKP